jgi:hypothetical protein
VVSCTVRLCVAAAAPPVWAAKESEVGAELRVYVEVLTVSVAALLVALPAEFVTTTENVAPLLPTASVGVV